MKATIGLTDEARREVGQILNLLLADEYVLCVTTRDYDWNVSGPGSQVFSLQFEGQSEQVSGWIYKIAERLRAIGVGVRGNWADVTKAARSSADPGSGLLAGQMRAELLSLHEALIVRLRSDSAACLDRYQDADTAKFLTGLRYQHETTAWVLRPVCGARRKKRPRSKTESNPHEPT